MYNKFLSREWQNCEVGRNSNKSIIPFLLAFLLYCATSGYLGSRFSEGLSEGISSAIEGLRGIVVLGEAARAYHVEYGAWPDSPDVFASYARSYLELHLEPDSLQLPMLRQLRVSSDGSLLGNLAPHAREITLAIYLEDSMAVYYRIPGENNEEVVLQIRTMDATEEFDMQGLIKIGEQP